MVEDHADTAKMLGKLLGSAGYTVCTAGNAAGALELAAKEPFDLMVSDIGLPDDTGYRLMEQIKRRHGIVGIAMSGYGMDEDIRRSQEAGFSDHLVKPISFAARPGDPADWRNKEAPDVDPELSFAVHKNREPKVI